MAQTVIEKIVQSHAVGLDAGQMIQAADYVTLIPDHVMTQVITTNWASQNHNLVSLLSR